MRKLVTFLVVFICFSSFKAFNQPHFTAAIMYNEIKSVQKLIDEGANVNDHAKNICFPLTYSAEYKRLEIAELLLKNGAKFDTCPDLHGPLTSNQERYPAFYYAISLNQIDMVKLFCKYGYDVTNKINGTHFTYPIIISAGLGDTAIFNFLLEKGVDVTVSNFNGENALMHSVATNNLEITKKLLQKGLPVNDTSNIGVTPLMIAATVHGINFEIIDLLINNGADLTYTNRHNLSAFSLSCLYNNRDLALYLSEQGAKGKESEGAFELNARMNHFLGDYFWGKNDINSSKGYYEKAKPFYDLSISKEKEKLSAVRKKLTGNFVLEVLSAAISSTQASVQANQEGQKLGLSNSQVSLLRASYAETNRMIWSPFYKKNPTILYDYRLSAFATLDEQKEFYKNKIKQFEMSIGFIDGIVSCIDKKLAGEELNSCIQNIQLTTK
jgi:ankyrin repeat protein